MDKIKIKQETLLNLLEYINEKEWVTLKDKEGEPYHVKIEKDDNKNLLDKIQNIKLKKYKPTTYTINWGKQKQQGKRIGKMVIGAMSDVSLQGKKEYTNILGSFSQEEQNEINSYLRENYEKLLYAKAREYGLNKDEALNFVLKVYN